MKEKKKFNYKFIIYSTGDFFLIHKLDYENYATIPHYLWCTKKTLLKFINIKRIDFLEKVRKYGVRPKFMGSTKKSDWPLQLLFQWN